MDQNRIPEELKIFLAGSQFPWAVCGGFALDLFLGRNIRPHGDIDICVFEQDREAVKNHALDKNWQVYEFRGQGKVHPLTHGLPSDGGRNLMCVREGCDLVKFYPCEDPGMLYHQFFHTGIKEFHYLEFLFNSVSENCLVLDQRKGLRRELPKAILNPSGIPCLAPEIVLLYKASDFENPAYQLDFDETYPCLDEDQKAWFLESMQRLYPNGHPWVKDS